MEQARDFPQQIHDGTSDATEFEEGGATSTAAGCNTPTEPASTLDYTKRNQAWQQARSMWRKDTVDNGAVRRRWSNIDMEGSLRSILDHEGDEKGLLPQPISLSQAIDLLLDIWDAEGIIDR